jgi:hypothetical protein
LPTHPGLKVTNALVAFALAVNEDSGVISALVSAQVAQRRVVALGTDFKRSSCPWKLVTAITAETEHRMWRIGQGRKPLEAG